MHRDTVTRSWGPLSCHSFAAITSCFSMIMNGPMICTQFLEAENVPVLQLPVYSPAMSHIKHVWDALDQRVQQCTTGCSSSCHYQVTSHSHWREVGQNSGGQFQQPDQLYAKEMCCTECGKWWSHQILTGFLLHAPSFFKGICDQQMHIYIPSHVKTIDYCLMNLFQLTDFLIWTVTQ